MCRGVDSALCLLCIPAASFVLGKHEVTSQWRAPSGQAAKQGGAEDKIRARASASQKRGPVEDQDADDHDSDGGDEEEEVEEDEEEEDEEDKEADSEVQEVKVVKHKEKEKVSSPAMQKTRFKPAVFVKKDSSPPQKIGPTRKKAPRRGDPGTVEMNRMHSLLARYGTTTKILMGHAQFCLLDDGPRKTRLAATMHLLADPTSFYLRQRISIRVVLVLQGQLVERVYTW